MADRLTLRTRASGVLLHPTSLPGPHGIGDLGRGALRFAEFLAEAGQRWWQMLPVGPTTRGHAPYTSPSSFAGNPLLLSIERLAADGLLSRRDLAPPPGLPAGRVRYDAVIRFKEPLLRKAAAAFSKRGRPGLDAFVRANASWLPDYALYEAIKASQGGAEWTDWEPALRRRDPAALERARKGLDGEVHYRLFLQLQFARQWEELKSFCARRGIGLIGDVPIFACHDSADVWTRPELFHLDVRGRPTDVAGVPPDYFSRDGQLWGNPLHRWEAHRRRGYDWWIARLRAVFRRFDAVRLDHFIGFHRVWAVPAGEKTARRGRWWPVPGAPFFEAVLRALGPIELIAEDLGIVTPEVKALRDRFGFPGMSVLQFAFGTDPEFSPYRVHNHPRRCVVYTGTHDNDTTVGWFRDRGGPGSTRTREEIRRERAEALRYLGGDGGEIHWDMIRMALLSPADTAILPAQDLLGLGSEARMNTPGTTKGNWMWRLGDGSPGPRIAARLRMLTETYGRVRKH